jgi:cation:H+ antiporter
MVAWLQFFACAAVVLISGTYLSKYGDIIAEKTGLGRTWIGVVLMASVTSLPELMTGISSVALFDLPDITAGNLLGACMLNVAMLALLDAIGGPTPISSKAHQGQVLTAGCGIFMLGVVSLSMVLEPLLPPIGWIGPYSALLIATYLIAMRMIFFYEKKRVAAFIKEVAEELRYRDVNPSRAYAVFGVNAVILIGAASYLPRLGEEIAELTGLGETLVGSTLIAVSTTLPELVVSVSALRIGAVDMAVGNLLGSNLFNVTVLAVDDLFYTKGPILSFVSGAHLVTAVAAMMMTSLAVVGFTYRPNEKFFFLAWDAVAILLFYIVTACALYAMR